MNLITSTIRFPEIALATRDAHKLRGYFGNLFKEHSLLLHNHYETGESAFQYPLVQYKVIDKIPILIGIQEGAELLTSLFLKIKEIKIEEKYYRINYKNIENKTYDIGVKDDLYKYNFETLWFALNQKNHLIYKQLEKENDINAKNELFKNILKGNILSFFKYVRYIELSRINIMPEFIDAGYAKFKNIDMKVFKGTFTSNVILPDFIGLGKSVSRGFGSIKRI